MGIAYITGIFININSWISFIICSLISAVLGCFVNYFIVLEKQDRNVVFNIFKNAILKR
jgi:hypothetical protein